MNPKNPAVIKALKEVKDKQESNKKRELEMSKRMFPVSETQAA